MDHVSTRLEYHSPGVGNCHHPKNMTLIVRLSNVFSTDNPFQALPSTPTPADRKSKLVISDRQTRSQPSSRRTGGSLLNLHRQAQSWSGLSDSQSSRHRKATKAALSLAQLILDPPDADIRPPAATHRTSPKAEGRRGSGGSSVGNSLNTSTRKTTVPRLREKDVARLRTQLLKPESAGLVIAQARRLNKDQIQHDQLYQQNGHIAPNGVEPTRAVCLDCDESKAEDLIRHAAKTQKARMQQEIQLGHHKYSTLKTMPPAPARLPVLLSLLEPLEPAKSDAKRDSDAHLGKLEDALISLRMEEADSEDSSQGPMLPFGLMLPPSAMSLHRPLAGALPTADTLRRGFDALLNAESKVYMYEGPSHKGMHPPTDRLSIYTCK